MIEEIKMLSGWFNFRTGETDWLYELPTDYRDYIPQDVASQGIYTCSIRLGKEPAEAAIEVLKRWTGKS